MTLYSSTISSDSPVAWWRLGEMAGTSAADSSGNGNTLAIAGGFTLAVSGALAGDGNGAIMLDGTSGYLIAASYAPRPTATLTLEAWVYLTSATGPGRTIAKNWADTLFGAFHWELNASAQPELFIAQSNGTAIGPIDDPTPVPVNAWQYLAVVADGPTIRMYRNGVQVASASYDGTLKADYAPLGVGVKTDDAGTGTSSSHPDFFAGRMDEVAIYDTPLSAGRILAHYNAGIVAGIAARVVAGTA